LRRETDRDASGRKRKLLKRHGFSSHASAIAGPAGEIAPGGVAIRSCGGDIVDNPA
jgi:hypothetical protein